MVDPPALTAHLPGTGGRIKRRPEDFEVEELPAYEADGTPDRHLLLTLRKRGMNTADAVAELARQLELDPRDLGVAGLKDRDALTTQRVSVPADAGPALERFEHPAIQLGAAVPHATKLRRGHLRGNRFTIVLRELPIPIEEAIARVEAKLDLLRSRHGFDNVYGPQRFGFEGRNLERGLHLVRAGRRVRPGDLILSAAQSGLFNLWVVMRRELGLDRTLLTGDLVKKTATGGMFTADEIDTEQARLDAGEIVVTGPMFGGRMRGPREGSPSEALEEQVLARAGLTRAQLARLGRKVPGTRRELQVMPGEFAVEAAEAVDELGPGLRLRFTLPPGSYATVLLAELMG